MKVVLAGDSFIHKDVTVGIDCNMPNFTPPMPVTMPIFNCMACFITLTSLSALCHVEVIHNLSKSAGLWVYGVIRLVASTHGPKAKVNPNGRGFCKLLHTWHTFLFDVLVGHRPYCCAAKSCEHQTACDHQGLHKAVVGLWQQRHV